MDFKKCHFLLVEDDVLESALVVSALEKLSPARIDIAKNGKVAVGFIDDGEHMPDIIISDILMPELDGVEFMTHLARRRFVGGIVLISGADQRLQSVVITLALAHKLNLLGTLSKPFTSVALQDMLARFGGPNPAADAQIHA